MSSHCHEKKAKKTQECRQGNQVIVECSGRALLGRHRRGRRSQDFAELLYSSTLLSDVLHHHHHDERYQDASSCDEYSAAAEYPAAIFCSQRFLVHLEPESRRYEFSDHDGVVRIWQKKMTFSGFEPPMTNRGVCTRRRLQGVLRDGARGYTAEASRILQGFSWGKGVARGGATQNLSSPIHNLCTSPPPETKSWLRPWVGGLGEIGMQRP